MNALSLCLNAMAHLSDYPAVEFFEPWADLSNADRDYIRSMARERGQAIVNDAPDYYCHGGDHRCTCASQIGYRVCERNQSSMRLPDR
jgi:hypothetical protein